MSESERRKHTNRHDDTHTRKDRHRQAPRYNIDTDRHLDITGRHLDITVTQAGTSGQTLNYTST